MSTFNVLNHGMYEFVRLWQGHPILASYSRDGWKTKTTDTIRVPMNASWIERKGQATKEFLLERSFVRAGDPESPAGAAMVHWPREFALGIRVGNSFTAFLESCCTLRESGHYGPCVTGLCFDGLQREPLGKLIVAHHHAWYQDPRNYEGMPVSRFELENLDWCFTIPCLMHIINLACRWGQKHIFIWRYEG